MLFVLIFYFFQLSSQSGSNSHNSLHWKNVNTLSKKEKMLLEMSKKDKEKEQKEKQEKERIEKERKERERREREKRDREEKARKLKQEKLNEIYK
ncbi:hypothetical protein H311_01057 [Anncaliia algerae PRA109]|nr:hypothetical protein H311_01057 [Anncaliia algerae PRA109]